MKKNRTMGLRRHLLLFTACTVAGGVMVAHAQTAPTMVGPTAVGPTTAGPTAATSTPIVVPGDGAPAGLTTYQIKKIRILYQKLLLKEKDIPNAISHVTPTQIATEGNLGSIQSVLRQTPSVNEYQSGPGQGVPVLTVRGVRLAELAETLDGTPMTDILQGGQGAFLTNNIGSPVTLGQLGGTTVYPGIAPPADQGFGTGGGTIAYQTKDPSATRSAELFGSYGSFNTSDAGFELNSGSINGQPDGTRVMLRYDQGYTDGYIDNTNERSSDLLFKAVKPYDNGLSNVSATVIYNRGFGYINTSPLPVPLIDANSPSFNFPKSLTFSSEDNDYLTAILHDETYINPHLILSGDLFELHTTGDDVNFQAANSVAFNPAFPFQITFQIPFLAFGPFGATAVANGLSGLNVPPNFDPFNAAPAGSDPTNPNSFIQGESAERIITHENTVGFQPKANIFLPYNNITVGGLFSKSGSGSTEFDGSGPVVPEDVNNAIVLGGGDTRTVYQVYGQDKIDILNNKLHLQPGLTIASAQTSVISQFTLTHPPFKLENFSAVAEPYAGVSYDLPGHVTAFASYGKGADFTPVADYAPAQDANGIITGTEAPKPEIIHLYEAGLRYDTNRLYINADFYYQKINDADSFFTNFQTGQTDFGNDGAEQFRGYELDTEYRATPELSFFANASFNQSNYLTSYFAEDTPFEDQFGYVFQGDPLASVPNWLSNFGFDYEKGNFGARLTEEYTGQQFITYDLPANINPNIPNVTNNPGCSGGTNVPNQCLALATTPGFTNSIKSLLSNGSIPFIKQPGFLISNLLLSYDMPIQHSPLHKLHFTLNLQNFLDIHYKSHLFNAPAEIPQNGGFAVTPSYFSAFEGAPRSITVSMSAKF